MTAKHVLATVGGPGGAPSLGVVFVIVAIAAVFVIYCLIDLARVQEVRYLPRWLWGIICLISVPLGGIIYLTVGKVRT